MIEHLIQLVVLFFVIFDPPVSFIFFYVSTHHLPEAEKRRIALIALTIAVFLSYIVLLLGNHLLTLFNTNIDEFRIAGGIILALLGIRMSLGQSLTKVDEHEHDSSIAIASIIGTPLLTGPAAITTIIITVNDYGRLVTGSAVSLVLLFTAFLLFNASRFNRFMGRTTVQISSTILGLITLAWGVSFIRHGLGI